ncbi:MAG: hypothetical protein QM571_04255 [Micrococcaceae bacterium]
MVSKCRQNPGQFRNEDGIEYVTESNSSSEINRDDYDSVTEFDSAYENSTNNESSSSSDCVWFSQLVANGGVGLPKAPDAGEVFREDIEINVSEKVLNEHDVDSLSVMLILVGDAYFEVKEKTQMVVNIPVKEKSISGSIQVGSVDSGYPIRVREIFQFFGLFTLQVVLVENVDEGRVLSSKEIIEKEISAANPYALFMIDK